MLKRDMNLEVNCAFTWLPHGKKTPLSESPSLSQLSCQLLQYFTLFPHSFQSLPLSLPFLFFIFFPVASNSSCSGSPETARKQVTNKLQFTSLYHSLWMYLLFFLFPLHHTSFPFYLSHCVHGKGKEILYSGLWWWHHLYEPSGLIWCCHCCFQLEALSWNQAQERAHTWVKPCL